MQCQVNEVTIHHHHHHHESDESGEYQPLDQ